LANHGRSLFADLESCKRLDQATGIIPDREVTGPIARDGIDDSSFRGFARIIPTLLRGTPGMAGQYQADKASQDASRHKLHIAISRLLDEGYVSILSHRLFLKIATPPRYPGPWIRPGLADHGNDAHHEHERMNRAVSFVNTAKTVTNPAPPRNPQRLLSRACRLPDFMAFIAVAPDFHPGLFRTSYGKKPKFFSGSGNKA
jgi:hypothetical protein